MPFSGVLNIPQAARRASRSWAGCQSSTQAVDTRTGSRSLRRRRCLPPSVTGIPTRMIKGLIRGALAGAAGTTALNAAGYADMAWRGRPSSSTPKQAAE